MTLAFRKAEEKTIVNRHAEEDDNGFQGVLDLSNFWSTWKLEVVKLFSINNFQSCSKHDPKGQKELKLGPPINFYL